MEKNSLAVNFENISIKNKIRQEFSALYSPKKF